MDKIREHTKKFLRKDAPKFGIGDVVRVHVKIVEAGKERVQLFEGTVIARKGSGINETFIVRRVSYGEGLERVFLLNSPSVEKIEVIKTGKIKRAKLYYLRQRSGKKAKIEEKIVTEQQQPDNSVRE